MKVQIINRSKNDLPQYETPFSAGMDLRANIDADIIIKPMQRILVPTGLFIELPQNYEAQIRPRSGLCFKNGITVLNSPGTIDSDYRGEIKVLLINLSENDFTIHNSDRIAQMVISPIVQVEWQTVDQLSTTLRAEGGFGHTGTK